MLTKLGLAALAATIGLTGLGGTASAHERDGRAVIMDHGGDYGRDGFRHERIARQRFTRERFAQWRRARLRAEWQRRREEARRVWWLNHYQRPYGVR
jgi:hypothetical protein